MSRAKKTPPPAPPLPVVKAKAARVPRKPPAAKASPTVEAVMARLMALPQVEGTTPALWRQADFGAELARAEKGLLESALARLEAERRLVALSYGKSVYYAFADALLSPVSPGAPVSPDDLMNVYRRLVRESGGFPDVKISLLAKGLGPGAAGGLAERLKALWGTGDATLSLGDWSLANEETRAAAVEMYGEKYLLVRFEEA